MTKKFITPELLALVIAEAVKIKAEATPEEIARLNVKTLKPSKYNKCFYGQLSGGHYWNERCKELRRLVETYSVELVTYIEPMSMYYGFTPIEFYIARRGADRKAIIDFVKGETNNLLLTI